MAKAAKKGATKAGRKPAAKAPEKAAIPSSQNLTDMATNDKTTSTQPGPGTAGTGTNTGATTTTTTTPTATPTPPEATTTRSGGDPAPGDTTAGKMDTDSATGSIDNKTGPPAQGDTKGPAVGGSGTTDSYTVLQEFRDKSDFGKVYKEGDPFTSTDKNRLADLEKKNLIKKA